MKKNNIIGGLFGLQNLISTSNFNPLFLKKSYVLLINARSCIYYVTQMISPRIIWMPSFLCDVMLKAVNGFKVKFYEINYDLKIQSLDWINNIKDDDLVVLIDYFGMPVDNNIAKEIKQKNAWIIEDASQALLSNYTRKYADFVIFSLRKFIGVPDGGILIINSGVELPRPKLKSPPANWWLKACYSTMLRREFDMYGRDRLWFELFKDVDDDGPIGNYSMSELSENIFKYCYDYSDISDKRRTNYKFLLDTLKEYCIYTEFDSDSVPIGFPIRLNNRDEVRQKLFDQNIFPPIHWNINKIISKQYVESHKLSNDIMTLPCDQRYNEDDMMRMGKIILFHAK